MLSPARGDWEPGVDYEMGEYVYSPIRSDYYYVCVTPGKSQSSTQAKSTDSEPNWPLNSIAMEGILIWKFVPYDGTATKWAPNRLYTIGDLVIPTTGPVIWENDPYAYKLIQIVYEPRWGYQVGELVYDNTVVWETKLSTRRFFPDIQKTKTAFIHAYESIDFLMEKEASLLNDVLYKYADRSKVSKDALTSAIDELGFTYISNILDLKQDELSSLVAYMSMIHKLKGTRPGLEFVLQELGISYNIQEWWEQEPTGTPETFKMEIDLNAGNVTNNTIPRIKDFVRQYVYPIMNEITISFYHNLADMSIFLGGVTDRQQDYEICHGFMMLTGLGGFCDYEIEMEIPYEEETRVCEVAIGLYGIEDRTFTPREPIVPDGIYFITGMMGTYDKEVCGVIEAPDNFDLFLIGPHDGDYVNILTDDGDKLRA